MCGICGIVTDNQHDIKSSLSLMNKAIIHRGPDDEGFFEQANAGLAMRRLSIIDLKTGHQPMYSVDKRLVIVFNGEIYNYRELKQKYLTEYSFATSSDTEVVLNLYHKMGNQCLEYLRGIFAFAIYNIPAGQLFIARDQIGVKPLYYYSDEHVFMFSSDLISFHHLSFLDLTINHKILGDYLRFGYIPQPSTIFEKVHALRPGNFAIINKQARVSMVPYYDILKKVNKTIDSDFASSKDKLRYLIHESVVEQMVSDVPLGAFLSGGIDSSVICSEMASVSTDSVNTFTIGFHGASNNKDLELSALVSSHIGTNHLERIVEPDISEVLDKIIDNLGEPFAVSSTIPIFINSSIAREKVKVVLSGDGADEILGGYGRYRRFFSYKNIEWLRHLPLSQINDISRSLIGFIHSSRMNKVHRLKMEPFLSFFSQPDDLHRYLKIIGATNDIIIKKLIKKDASNVFQPSSYAKEFELITELNGVNINSLMMFDMQTSLVDEMLTKVDFASMLASVEVRVPFLDHRLVEYGLNMEGEFKVHRSVNKMILREAYRDRLPSVILNAPKRGFNLPIDNWIKNHWSASFIEMFNNTLLDDLNIDRLSVNNYFRAYLSGYPINGKIFFYIYILVRWYEKLKARRENEY